MSITVRYEKGKILQILQINVKYTKKYYSYNSSGYSSLLKCALLSSGNLKTNLLASLDCQMMDKVEIRDLHLNQNRINSRNQSDELKWNFNITRELLTNYNYSILLSKNVMNYTTITWFQNVTYYSEILTLLSSWSSLKCLCL